MITAEAESGHTSPIDRKIKILHVDDNRLDLDLTKIRLIQLHDKLEIVSATSGKMAIEHTEKEEFDCIISDFKMPDIDGIEFLKRVKSKNKAIPFIFLTGQGNENIAAEALRAGADDYFIKGANPAHFERLLHSIKKHSQAYCLHIESVRAKAALVESENRFRILFEHAPEAILVAERRGYKIVDANENALRLLNISRDEILQKSTFEFLPEKQPNGLSRSNIRLLYDKAIHGEIESFEINIRNTSGKNLLGEARIALLPSADRELVRVSFLDLTERKMAESKVRLHKILTQKINEAPSLAKALIHALDEITETIDWQFGEAWVMDESSKNLMSLSSSWQELSLSNSRVNVFTSGLQFKKGKGFLHRLCERKKPEWIEDIRNCENSTFIRKSQIEKGGFRSVFGIPIIANDAVEAVFVFFNSDVQSMDADLVEFISAVTSQISSLIERKRAEEKVRLLNEEIYDTQKEFIYILGEVVENRSKETANHVRRIAETCYHLALLAGLGENKARTIRAIAPMHDIGKIGIPDSILLKPGKLTKEEFEFVKTHTTIGYSILKASSRELLEKAAIIALQHHEHWDGNGYPHGLKGEEIHIFGRITAIADVFDALSHKRVYKDAWEIERIVEHIADQKGKQFDPDLADLFLDNIGDFKRINEFYTDTPGAVAVQEAAPDKLPIIVPVQADLLT